MKVLIKSWHRLVPTLLLLTGALAVSGLIAVGFLLFFVALLVW
jgi:hypothetical protein